MHGAASGAMPQGSPASEHAGEKLPLDCEAGRRAEPQAIGAGPRWAC
jgi:hypothetical protein